MKSHGWAQYPAAPAFESRRAGTARGAPAAYRDCSRPPWLNRQSLEIARAVPETRNSPLKRPKCLIAFQLMNLARWGDGLADLTIAVNLAGDDSAGFPGCKNGTLPLSGCRGHGILTPPSSIIYPSRRPGNLPGGGPPGKTLDRAAPFF